LANKKIEYIKLVIQHGTHINRGINPSWNSNILRYYYYSHNNTPDNLTVLVDKILYASNPKALAEIRNSYSYCFPEALLTTDDSPGPSRTGSQINNAQF
jgi:hypothetical protein